MPQYTPPTNQVVNFTMQTYTPPINGVVNFVMDEYVPPAPGGRRGAMIINPNSPYTMIVRPEGDRPINITL